MEAREFVYPMNKVAVEPEDLALASSFTVSAAARGRYLYLFIKVKDQQVNYHRPSSGLMATGDQLIIRVSESNTSGLNSRIRRYTFRWEAPGSETGRYLGDAIDGVRPQRIGTEYRAALAESSDGYNIELRVPLPIDGKFGLSFIDVDSQDNVPRWTGMFDPDEPDDVGQLQLVDAELSAQLLPFTEPGMRMRVFNGQGWLVADADQRLPDASVREFSPADRSIFDAVLHRFITWSHISQLSD